MSTRLRNLMPNEREALSRLWLNATDAARVCGVTVRQLTYWTDKGIIASRSQGGRSYDVPALTKAIAIKRAMLAGYSLEKAAQMYESGSAPCPPAPDQAPADSGALVAYIDGLAKAVADCRQLLPARLALGRLRRTVGLLDELDIDGLLGAAPEREEQARRVSSRLNQATDEVRRALEEITADLAAVQRGGRNVREEASVV